jgi:hypothetical protein
MTGRTRNWLSIALVAFSLAPATAIGADLTCENLEEWIPGDVVAYARIDGLGQRIDDLLGSKLLKDIETTTLGQVLTANDGFAEALAYLKSFKETSGREAVDVLKSLVGSEVVVAARLTFIGIPEVLMLSRGKSAEDLAQARTALEKVVEMYLGQRPTTKKGNHNGHLIESLGKGHFAIIGDVLAVSNSKGMIESAIDLAEGKETRSVKKSEIFAKVASKARKSSFIHAAVRPRFIPGFKIPEQMDNAAGSFLLGGLSEALRVSEAISLAIDVEDNGVTVRVLSVADGRGIDAKYDAFFPKKLPDDLKSRLRSRGILGFVEVHRDLAKWWERGEDFLEPRAAGDLTEFAGNLSLFFGGKSFEDEVLTELGETITFVAMNQSYKQAGAKPSPTIPGMAALFDLRDAKKFGRSFKVAFNTIVGIINVNRMQQEKDAATMLIEPKLVGKTECYTVDMGLAPSGDKVPGIEYNFTPSMAIAGNRVILSSSFELLEVLVDELAKSVDSPTGKTVVAKPTKDRIFIDATAAYSIVADNRDFFASTNMVKKGIDLDEARGEIDAILEIVSFLRDFELVSFRSNEKVHLNLRLRLNPDRKAASVKNVKTAANGE